jgi:murein DD-endopeptidase MepM/ murein hydrolase activator NlpD
MTSGDRHRKGLRVLVPVAAIALLSSAGLALGQDLNSQLDNKQAALGQQRDEKQALVKQITDYSAQISQIEGELATLKQRVDQVTAELDQLKVRLRTARARLAQLRRQLHSSLTVLEQRLVAMYEESQPDMLTVILEANGFQDLVERVQYLSQIHEQDTEIVTRVRGLRTEQAATVATIEEAKAQVAAKRRELARTEAEVQARHDELAQAKSKRAAALDQVQGKIQNLEGDVSDLQDQIASQLQASSTTTAPPPSGEVSSSGMIWPVNGPITSYFCEVRPWESCHPGIDIGVPAGTPIHAAEAGTVSIAAYTGGYGNYTCIDHGGGISTCYAHQSSMGVSVGQSVSQGQVIGLVGCTGLCFGDHLHFEVRVNGSVTDPLNYLP